MIVQVNSTNISLASLGGNTMGKFFTPRHVTRFIADICEVSKNDAVV